ncbi:MAG: DUF3568 family protein [Planctomycetota bacterium]
MKRTHRPRGRILFPTIFAVSAALALPGCVAAVAVAGAGGGAYAFFKGDLERRFETDITTVWTAVRQAVDELELEVISDEFDGLEASLAAKRSDGQIVRIEAEGNGRVSTNLKVRVGASDRSKSRTILRRIEFALPPGTPLSTDISLAPQDADLNA